MNTGSKGKILTEDGSCLALPTLNALAVAIPASAIVRAIAYAIDQPAEVEVDEMVIRPTAQDF
jgi:NADP-dependent 3-hydroxy acid dehydrogenase YdfG